MGFPSAYWENKAVKEGLISNFFGGKVKN